jgi:hypothetical protein
MLHVQEDNFHHGVWRKLLQNDTVTGSSGDSVVDGSPDEQLEPYKGAWTRGWDLVMCLVPIVFLVLVTMIKRIHMDTSRSLPLSAIMMWIIRLAYLRLDPNFTNAAVVYGLFDALKPLSIITGAICLFESMEETKVWLSHHAAYTGPKRCHCVPILVNLKHSANTSCSACRG